MKTKNTILTAIVTGFLLTLGIPLNAHASCLTFQGFIVGNSLVLDCSSLESPIKNPDFCASYTYGGDLNATGEYFEKYASGHWDATNPDVFLYDGYARLTEVEPSGQVHTIEGKDKGVYDQVNHHASGMIFFEMGTGRFEGATGVMRYHSNDVSVNNSTESSYFMQVCGPNL